MAKSRAYRRSDAVRARERERAKGRRDYFKQYLAEYHIKQYPEDIRPLKRLLRDFRQWCADNGMPQLSRFDR